MLLRLWRTGFDPERLDELNEFARTRSTPMFDSFPGCMGHMFSHAGDEYVTISMWIGSFAIKQAEASDLYRETVDALVATGILRGEQEVVVYDVDALNLGWESRRRADAATATAVVHDSRKPDFVADGRDGFVGVEARVLVGRDDLVVSELRIASNGRIPVHPAEEEVQVACTEGSGWTRVGEIEEPFRAGQWSTWPAGIDHGLGAGSEGMTVVIIHPRPD